MYLAHQTLPALLQQLDIRSQALFPPAQRCQRANVHGGPAPVSHHVAVVHQRTLPLVLQHEEGGALDRGVCEDGACGDTRRPAGTLGPVANRGRGVNAASETEPETDAAQFQ